MSSGSVIRPHLFAPLAVLLTLVFLLPPAASVAEAGDWKIRFRAITVSPDEESSAVRTNGVEVPGTSVSVDDDTVPELDITYMLTRNLGVELVLGTSEHNVSGEGGLAGLGEIVEAGVLPPTLVLQWHFAPDSAFSPYLGVGVNYTLFYDEESSSSLNSFAGGVSSVELDSSVGLAVQLGFDVNVGQKWFFNIDAKRIDLETEATIRTNGALGTLTVDVDLQPYVFGAGFGFRF